MIPKSDGWWWFGLECKPDFHVAYRVVTVTPMADMWEAHVWNKGEAGELWRRRQFKLSITFERAIAAAQRFIDRFCQAYQVVDEAPLEGQAWQYSETWWATFFGVSEDAEEAEVRSAYRSKLREVHPDLHPEEDKAEFTRQCRIVVEAYDQYQKEVKKC